MTDNDSAHGFMSVLIAYSGGKNQASSYRNL
jgi:hypothetical protein